MSWLYVLMFVTFVILVLWIISVWQLWNEVENDDDEG